MRPQVQFWFDFASPYSYVAAERIEQEAERRLLSLEWKPFLLGPIFAEQYGYADSPFNRQPARGHYMWRDVDRICFKLGVAWKKPTVFPQNGVLASKVACIALREDWGTAFVRSVFRANFVNGANLSDRDVIIDILNSIGQDGPRVLPRAESVENRGLLRQNTDEAKTLGIFGAPNFIVGDELFWGQDRLEDALDWAVTNR